MLFNDSFQASNSFNLLNKISRNIKIKKSHKFKANITSKTIKYLKVGIELEKMENIHSDYLLTKISNLKANNSSKNLPIKITKNSNKISLSKNLNNSLISTSINASRLGTDTPINNLETHSTCNTITSEVKEYDCLRNKIFESSLSIANAKIPKPKRPVSIIENNPIVRPIDSIEKTIKLNPTLNSIRRESIESHLIATSERQKSITKSPLKLNTITKSPLKRDNKSKKNSPIKFEDLKRRTSIESHLIATPARQKSITKSLFKSPLKLNSITKSPLKRDNKSIINLQDVNETIILPTRRPRKTNMNLIALKNSNKSNNTIKINNKSRNSIDILNNLSIDKNYLRNINRSIDFKIYEKRDNSKTSETIDNYIKIETNKNNLNNKENATLIVKNFKEKLLESFSKTKEFALEMIKTYKQDSTNFEAQIETIKAKYKIQTDIFSTKSKSNETITNKPRNKNYKRLETLYKFYQDNKIKYHYFKGDATNSEIEYKFFKSKQNSFQLIEIFTEIITNSVDNYIEAIDSITNFFNYNKHIETEILIENLKFAIKIQKEFKNLIKYYIKAQNDYLATAIDIARTTHKNNPTIIDTKYLDSYVKEIINLSKI